MIVGALAVLFVAAIWFQFLYSPMESKASKAKTAAHDADTQVASLKQQLGLGGTAKTPTKKADIPVADLTAALPADEAEATFFRSIDALRISSGADWQSIAPTTAAVPGSITTVNVGITVQGTEDELARYVAGLSDLQRIFVTDNIAVTGTGSPDASGGVGGRGAIFSSDKLSMTISGRIFSQPTAAASTTAGAGGTTPATGAPAPTGSAPGSATVNG